MKQKNPVTPQEYKSNSGLYCTSVKLRLSGIRKKSISMISTVMKSRKSGNTESGECTWNRYFSGRKNTISFSKNDLLFCSYES
jgi:hypothetical protein